MLQEHAGLLAQVGLLFLLCSQAWKEKPAVSVRILTQASVTSIRLMLQLCRKVGFFLLSLDSLRVFPAGLLHTSDLHSMTYTSMSLEKPCSLVLSPADW